MSVFSSVLPLRCLRSTLVRARTKSIVLVSVFFFFDVQSAAMPTRCRRRGLSRSSRTGSARILLGPCFKIRTAAMIFRRTPIHRKCRAYCSKVSRRTKLNSIKALPVPFATSLIPLLLINYDVEPHTLIVPLP